MKSSNASLLLVIIAFFAFGFSSLSFARNGNSYGKSYTYTNLRLTPKQFSKGYKAEKRQHNTVKSTSHKKFQKRKKGSWLERWLSRNY